MTSAMLAALPPLPRRRARVLDACCGSGVIGAALLQRDSSLRLHLLDADALALAAAAENVPQARRLLLCSGWPDEAAAFPRRAAAGLPGTIGSSRTLRFTEGSPTVSTSSSSSSAAPAAGSARAASSGWWRRRRCWAADHPSSSHRSRMIRRS